VTECNVIDLVVLLHDFYDFEAIFVGNDQQSYYLITLVPQNYVTISMQRMVLEMGCALQVIAALLTALNPPTPMRVLIHSHHVPWIQTKLNSIPNACYKHERAKRERKTQQSSRYFHRDDIYFSVRAGS